MDMNGIPESQMLEDAPNVNLTILIEKKRNKIPYGYCQCGCGGIAPIAKYTDKRFGHVKGCPVSFIVGHNSKLQPKGKLSPNYGKPGLRKERNPMWNGGTRKGQDGRIFLLRHSHPRSDTNGYVLRSVILAEKALGKPLPHNAQIHHFDENPSNDYNNLVLCENHRYHCFLHQRKRAYDACGHVNWRKCSYCKQYDEPTNLCISALHSTSYHKLCKKEYERERYQKTKNSV